MREDRTRIGAWLSWEWQRLLWGVQVSVRGCSSMAFLLR